VGGKERKGNETWGGGKRIVPSPRVPKGGGITTTYTHLKEGKKNTFLAGKEEQGGCPKRGGKGLTKLKKGGKEREVQCRRSKGVMI